MIRRQRPAARIAASHHLVQCRRLACVACGFLVLVHPLIHGTFLDSGALDAMLGQLQMWATVPVDE